MALVISVIFIRRLYLRELRLHPMTTRDLCIPLNNRIRNRYAAGNLHGE